MRISRRIVALIVAAGVFLAGCGGTQEAGPAPPNAQTAAEQVAPEPPANEITGDTEGNAMDEVNLAEDDSPTTNPYAHVRFRNRITLDSSYVVSAAGVSVRDSDEGFIISVLGDTFRRGNENLIYEFDLFIQEKVSIIAAVAEDTHARIGLVAIGLVDENDAEPLIWTTQDLETGVLVDSRDEENVTHHRDIHMDQIGEILYNAA